MNRFWSILFFLVPILGLAVCLWSAFGWYPFEGTWLPDDISASGADTDFAFLVVMWIIGIVFVGTGVFLALALWKDGFQQDRRAAYTHGNTRLEIIWSVIPGLVLIGIFVLQAIYWQKQKIDVPTVTAADGSQVFQKPLVRVEAHQFGWRFWYAGLDGEIDTPDDFMLENELYLPMDETVVLQLESADVLHSFYLRHLRIKQDLVPGRRQFVWFEIVSSKVKPGQVYDLLCAELCGWGHSRMNGRLYPVTREDYNRFLARNHQLQNGSGILSNENASAGENSNPEGANNP